MKDPYVNLAQKTIKAFVCEGKVISPSSYLPDELLKKRAGVFVTLHKKSTKQLRGCIGTFIPTCKNIASEIIQNAISACTKDPRFPPVTKEELDDLEIHVDVLSELLPAIEQELDPKKYGLIVETDDGRCGLLLPDIEGVKTKEQQIEICRQKGFISPDEFVRLYKFSIERHK